MSVTSVSGKPSTPRPPRERDAHAPSRAAASGTLLLPAAAPRGSVPPSRAASFFTGVVS